MYKNSQVFLEDACLKKGLSTYKLYNVTVHDDMYVLKMVHFKKVKI